MDPDAQLALAADFLCPISSEIMKDPVVAADGHTYDRKMIQEWFKTQTTSPLTGAELETTALFANITLKKVIRTWLDSLPRARPTSAAVIPGARAEVFG